LLEVTVNATSGLNIFLDKKLNFYSFKRNYPQI